jgi:hypothetical protein
MNGSAIDRGLFVCTQYKTIEETEKKGNNYSTETICMPPLNSPSVIKIGQEGYFKRKSANFSLLDKNGVVRRGMIIKKGDVLVGKIVTKNTKNCIEVRTDCSRIIQEDEEGIVDRVFTHITPNGYRLIKVVVRNEKIPEIGDKFACYSPDHEVLTDKGWIFVNEITKEHVLACMVDKTKLEYHKPTEIQSYNYKGKMYNVNSSKISLCVTPNHRMYTGNCHRQSYNIQNAEQIYGKMRSYKNNIEQWNPPSELKTFTLPAYGNLPALELDLEAWCLFFGIWMAEGSCTICYLPTGGIKLRKVNIAANKQRVRDQLEICMKKLGLKWKIHMSKGELVGWNSNDLRLIYYLKPLSVGAINKSLPDWCYNLDMYHSQKLIEGMVLGDGCYMKNTTTVRYYTSSIKLRDDFQRLCLHAGWGCNYYLKSPKGTKSMCLGREITSNADYWTLTICKTQTKPLVNKYIKQGKQLDSWNEYDGKVYCCTVPTKDGLIFVRRNGKSVWCGQSRAAQKGTVGMIYRQEDMPFTNSGMVPDIIINPACIPSRMTVNQLIETALGKVSAVDGTYGDASPFTKNSINVADTIAEKLGKLGYERHGWERMYSGFTGEMLKAKVYIGPTYYQRLKHMVSNKMHCLTLDHEVLTITGWKYFNELTLQDKIATLVNGELEYVHPTHLHSYPKYKGEMYHIENQGIDLLATSKHRMYVSKPFGRKRIWQDYELIEAKQLLNKTVRYKKNARWLKKAYTVTLPAVTKTITIHKKIPELVINDMDSFITFFGIWYAEGWASGTDTCGRIQLAVNKQRVKDALYPALDKLGYKYTVAPDDKLTLVDYQLYRFMKPLSVGAPQKKFPSWVFELNLEQSRLLINSMILGDGSIGKNGCKMYYSSSKVLIDQFQQLCLHSGWASNITIHIPIGVVNHIKGRPVVNTHNILRASVITERVMPSVNLGTNKTVQKEYITTMECPVYCVSVPSEIFYVRRNGKPVWTGNSRARGRITMLTRQPLEGRSRDGSNRAIKQFQKSLFAIIIIVINITKIANKVIMNC